MIGRRDVFAQRVGALESIIQVAKINPAGGLISIKNLF